MLVGNVRAGGFQLNLQGTRQLGMAHTGTGFGKDAATLFFNPSGMSFLEGKVSVSLGVNAIRARVLYTEEAPGQYSAYNNQLIGTPFSFYAVMKPNAESDLAFGIGVYTPFGSRIQYEDDWKGQFLLREMSLQTIFIQPSVSYRLHPNISIGAGAVIATGDFSLRKGVPVQFQEDGSYGEATLSGKASGFGFNTGVYYQNENGLSAGLSYRSGVQVSVESGSAEFTVPSALQEYFPNTSFSTGLNLPASINLGVAYQMEKLTLAADINYVTWSVYDSLIIDFDLNTDKLADQRSPRHYKNAPIFRLGAEYTLNESLIVRAGAYLDQTPVDDGYLTPETPDSRKIGLTTGVSYMHESGFGADLCFLFIDGQNRFDTNLETQFTGTWKSRAWSLGAGIHYNL